MPVGRARANAFSTVELGSILNVPQRDPITGAMHSHMEYEELVKAASRTQEGAALLRELLGADVQQREQGTGLASLLPYLPPSTVPKGTEIAKIAGLGSTACVLLFARRASDPIFDQLVAVKYIKRVRGDQLTNPVEVERELQSRAAAYGVAPALSRQLVTASAAPPSQGGLYGNGSSPGDPGKPVFDVIVMDPIATTFAEMCLGAPATVLESATAALSDALVRLYTEAGITHGDMTVHNVGFNVSPSGTLRTVLIDFGQASGNIVYPAVDVSQFLRSMQLAGFGPDQVQYVGNSLNTLTYLVLAEKAGQGKTRSTGSNAPVVGTASNINELTRLAETTGSEGSRLGPGDFDRVSALYQTLR